MASLLGRLWARLRGPFERRFGEKWVEPGNAITRAIAAGLAPEKLYTPSEPVAARNVPTVEPAVAVAVADVAVTNPEPAVPEERKVRRGRPRRAA
jgi:hypothetical protein